MSAVVWKSAKKDAPVRFCHMNGLLRFKSDTTESSGSHPFRHLALCGDWRYEAKNEIRRTSLSKSWNKGVTLALEGPGKFTTIKTVQEASWALIEDWPTTDGEALDKVPLTLDPLPKHKK